MSSGAIMPGARAGLDRHVADGHAPFHRERLDRLAGVLEHVAVAARDAELADRREHHVLGRQPERQRAVEATSIVFGRTCGSVCVASTCSTSDVPMPNASAPNAPCVEVWLSPQTIVMPGCVSPSSGPITCTIPSRPLPVAKSRHAELVAVARAARRAARARAGR